MRIGTVGELWVYPVKSMRGKRVTTVELESVGIRGDRRFAFTSTNAPAGKPLLSSLERTAMLLHAPTSVESPKIRAPQGDDLALTDAALAGSFRVNVAGSQAAFTLLRSPHRPLTDVRPVSLVSGATLGALSVAMGEFVDPQRFRSNIILDLENGDPFAEEEWNGRTLCFGDEDDGAALLLRERIPRCRIVSLDPDTAEPNNTILRHLARERDGKLGMYATVLRPGMLRDGQPVHLV